MSNLYAEDVWVVAYTDSIQSLSQPADFGYASMVDPLQVVILLAPGKEFLFHGIWCGIVGAEQSVTEDVLL